MSTRGCLFRSQSCLINTFSSGNENLSLYPYSCKLWSDKQKQVFIINQPSIHRKPVNSHICALHLSFANWQYSHLPSSLHLLHVRRWLCFLVVASFPVQHSCEGGICLPWNRRQSRSCVWWTAQVCRVTSKFKKLRQDIFFSFFCFFCFF